MIQHYANELLHPTKGIDIPRPIPAAVHRAHFSSQLIVDSDTDSLMFEIKPDPFKFIRQFGVRRTAVPGVGALRSIDFSEAGDDDALYREIIGTTDEAWFYPFGAELTDGTRVPMRSIGNIGGVGTIANTSFVGWSGNDFRYDTANGWNGITVPGHTATIAIGNTGTSTITCSAMLVSVNAAGDVSVYAASGAAVVISGQNQATTTIVVPAGSFPEDLLCLAVRITNVAVTEFRWEDLVIAPTAIQINAATGHLSQKTYTLGQASYPSDAKLANDLDSLFADAQLYAPVACSSVINVTQVLRDQGGNFLAAYMPSRTSVSPDPDVAWNTLNTLSRSYPVATNHFLKGAHASWVGARIQDYEFRRPFQNQDWAELNYQSLPSTYLVAQRAVSADVSTARYYLDFSVAFAIQTFDPKLTMVFEPAFPTFLPLFLSLVAAHGFLVGENPDHLTRLKQLAIKVASDPRVQDLVRIGLAKALPLLMSAVV